MEFYQGWVQKHFVPKMKLHKRVPTVLPPSRHLKIHKQKPFFWISPFREEYALKEIRRLKNHLPWLHFFSSRQLLNTIIMQVMYGKGRNGQVEESQVRFLVEQSNFRYVKEEEIQKMLLSLMKIANCKVPLRKSQFLKRILNSSTNPALKASFFQAYRSWVQIARYVNERSELKHELFFEFCRERNLELVQEMLANFNISVNHQINGTSPAFLCFGDQKLLDLILSIPGLKINSRDPYGDTLLIKAYYKGD